MAFSAIAIARPYELVLLSRIQLSITPKKASHLIPSYDWDSRYLT